MSAGAYAFAAPQDAAPLPQAAAKYKAGDPFLPWKAFASAQFVIPTAIAKDKKLKPTAKLAYGRLLLYAGEDGRCYPSAETLGNEIGIGKKQAYRVLDELERLKYIRRDRRGPNPDFIIFLWHPSFDLERKPPGRADSPAVKDRTDVSTQDRTHLSTQDWTDVSTKRNQSKEIKERTIDRSTERSTHPKYSDYERRRVRGRVFAFKTYQDGNEMQCNDKLLDDILAAGNGAPGDDIAEYLADRLAYVQRNDKSRPKGPGWFIDVVKRKFSPTSPSRSAARPTTQQPSAPPRAESTAEAAYNPTDDYVSQIQNLARVKRMR